MFSMNVHCEGSYSEPPDLVEMERPPITQCIGKKAREKGSSMFSKKVNREHFHPNTLQLMKGCCLNSINILLKRMSGLCGRVVKSRKSAGVKFSVSNRH